MQTIASLCVNLCGGYMPGSAKSFLIRFLQRSSFWLFLLSLPALTYAGSWGINTINPGGSVDNLPPLAIKYFTNVTGPFPSNDWWPHLLTTAMGQGGNRMIALPNAYHYLKEDSVRLGLAVFYADNWGTGNVDNITYDSKVDLTVRTTNMRSTNGLFQKVSGWGDWNVRSVFGVNNRIDAEATITKGSPFLYLNFRDQNAPLIYFNSAAILFYDKDGNLILTNMSGSSYTGDHVGVRLKNGKVYGIFAPANSKFSNSNGKELTIKLGSGEKYASLASMPAMSDLGFFRQHAYAFVTNTEVSWSYNSTAQEVQTTFRFHVSTKRSGFSSDPLTTLFPHQYKFYNGPLDQRWYYSSRGRLRLFTSGQFTTVHPFAGMQRDFTLPNTNLSPTYSLVTQKRYLSQFSNQMGGSSGLGTDTYGQGLTLNRMAQALMLADKMGPSTSHLRNFFLTNLRNVLNDWFTYTPGEQRRYFTYWDANTARSNCWGALIGYDTSFGSQYLTDHHYHYGYFIYAAAVVASFDTNFKNTHGNTVDMIIREVNSPNRNDPLFPFLRTFDPYDGHCWAGGNSDGWNGNNQESTSESMNAWMGIYLWGLITRDNTYRDLGIYGYTTERQAELQYWYDVDGDNWNNPGFERNAVGVLSGSYMTFGTFFGNRAEFVYGIHWLPYHAGFTYFGYDPEFARSLYDGMCDIITRYSWFGATREEIWFDVAWAYQSLFDPDAVLAKWDASLSFYSPACNLYQFVHGMKAMGNPVDSVKAIGTPSYQVFQRNGTNTYMAYNPTSATQHIRFVGERVGSLGILTVPPRSTRSSRLLQVASADTNNHFEVHHDGTAYSNLPERVILKSFNKHDSIMSDYSGTVTISVSGIGSVTWSTNGCNAKGTLQNLAANKAIYTYSASDRGIVTLNIRNTRVESLTIRIRTATGKTNVSRFPDMLHFYPVQTLDHFKVVHDGLADITRPEKLILSARDSRDEIIQSWVGTVSLYLASGTNSAVDWLENTGGNQGSLSTSVKGRASYTFATGEGGIVTLQIRSSVKGGFNPQVKSSTGIVDEDHFPSHLNFKDIGWNIFVDKKNTIGPWNGRTWNTAYQKIQDAVNDFSDGEENNMLIAAGTYNEYVRMQGPFGSAAKPLMMRAFTNGVVIDATGQSGRVGYFWDPITTNVPAMLLIGGFGGQPISHLTLQDLTFTGSHVMGLYLWYAGMKEGTIRRCTFFKNNQGLASIAWNDNTLIENCVAMSNTTQGIILDGGTKACYLRNNIVLDNLIGIDSDASNKCDYNNVLGNADNYLRQAITYMGQNNISEDPQFLSRTLGHPDFLKIPRTSPCVDKGDPANDVDPGVYGLHIDMGRFEYNPYPIYIKVISPKGGEHWTARTNYPVVWSNNLVSSRVKLELYRGPLKSAVIATNIPTGTLDGSYAWTIPDTIPYATNYRILITDESNTWIMGRSASYFTITNDRFIWVDKPTNRQKVLSGSTITNRWRSTNVSSLVRLDIYRGELQYFCTIATQTPNDGSFVWQVPLTFDYGTNFKLRVTDYSNRLIYGQRKIAFMVTNTVAFTSNLIYVTKQQKKGPWNGHSWETAYTNIQSGISNLKNGNGKRILVAPGIYREKLRIDRASFSGSNILPNVLVGISNVVIDSTGSDFGLYLTANNIRFSNLTFINATNHGAYIFASSGHRFERIISAKNRGTGFMVQGGAGCSFINCTAWSNLGNGFHFASAETNSITNSISQENATFGCIVDIQNGLDYNNIWGNQLGNLIGTALPGANSFSSNSKFDITARYDREFLTLHPTSPCIDRGKPSTPIPSGGGSRVDLGAKEGQPIICPAVTVSGFTPARIGGLADLGGAGDLVAISGAGFRASRGTGAVYFGSLPASAYDGWSNTGILARAPKGFVSGRITVSNSCGLSAISVSTLKLLVPVINGFSPGAGYPGSSVSIFGSGFGDVQGDGQVLFNNSPASVNTWSDGLVTVTVPAVVGSNRIIVENRFGKSVSSAPFPETNYPLNSTLAWASAFWDAGQIPANAFDGNPFSRWLSDDYVDPQWVGIDLGSKKVLNKITTLFDDQISSLYSLQISTNTNQPWVTWRSNENGSAGRYTVTNQGKSVLARYVRFLGKERRPATAFHALYEMQIRRGYAHSANSNFKILTNTAVPASLSALSAFCTNDSTGKVVIRYVGTDPFSRSCTYVQAQFSTNNLTWQSMSSNRNDSRHSTQPLLFLSSGSVHAFVWNSTNDLGRTANPTVWVRISVNNGISNSLVSTSFPFSLDSLAPPAPILSQPTNGSFITSTPLLVWRRAVDPVGGITNYRVVLSSNNFISTQRVFLTSNGGLTNWSVVPALGAGTWKWKVRAKDRFSNLGGWSAVSSNLLDATPPSLPLPLMPTSNVLLNAASVEFRWTKSLDPESGIGGYFLELDQTSSAFANIFKSTNISDVNATNVSLLVGSDGVKYWRIRSVNRAGMSSSYILRSFILDTQNPDAPLLLSPVSNSLTTNLRPLFVWKRSAATDISNYRIRVSTNADFSDGYSVWTTTTNWSPPSDLTYSSWYWSVLVQDKTGFTNRSAVFLFEITQASNLPAPIQITTLSVDDGQRKFSLLKDVVYASRVSENVDLLMTFTLAGAINATAPVRIVYAWNGDPSGSPAYATAFFEEGIWKATLPASVTAGRSADLIYFQILADAYTLRNQNSGALYSSWGFGVKPLEKQAGEIVLLNNLLEKGKGERTTAVITLNEETDVKVSIFTINGDKVVDLLDKRVPASVVPVFWDGKNDRGEESGRGLYFLRVQLGKKSTILKIIIQ